MIWWAEISPILFFYLHCAIRVNFDRRPSLLMWFIIGKVTLCSRELLISVWINLRLKNDHSNSFSFRTWQISLLIEFLAFHKISTNQSLSVFQQTVGRQPHFIEQTDFPEYQTKNGICDLIRLSLQYLSNRIQFTTTKNCPRSISMIAFLSK